MSNSTDDDAAPVTLAELVARATAASGGEADLRRRLGVSRATMEHMRTSQRVLSGTEVARMSRALGLDMGQTPGG